MHRVILLKYNIFVCAIIVAFTTTLCVAGELEDTIAAISGKAQPLYVSGENMEDITFQVQKITPPNMNDIESQLKQIEINYQAQIDEGMNQQSQDSLSPDLARYNDCDVASSNLNEIRTFTESAAKGKKVQLSPNDELLVMARDIDSLSPFDTRDNIFISDVEDSKLQDKDKTLARKKINDDANFDVEDFGNAIGQLSIIDEMKKNILRPNDDMVLLFKGDRLTCDKEWGSDIKNCCNLKGIFRNIIGHKCPSEVEEILAPAVVRERRCVEIEGWQCVAKIAKKCRKWRKSFCCYQSRTARIFQQIAHHQLGISWGNAENPNCAPLDPHTFGKLNFDDPYAKSLLKELVDEANANAINYANKVNAKLVNCEDLTNMAVQLQERVGNYYAHKVKKLGDK